MVTDDVAQLQTVRPPDRQVRAVFDARTVTVYQAFRSEIADAALDAGTFVAPFGMGRMTWIKPSFLWMMARSGWATKPGQERVLAVRLTRDGWEQALQQACPSEYDPTVHPSQQAWQERKRSTTVRVQWDPERSLDMSVLPWRTIQVGLAGPVVRRYVGEWIEGITEVTHVAREVTGALARGERDRASARLPVELPYPLSATLSAVIGASPASEQGADRLRGGP
jgi:Domain of unknown function (DUF4291)